jgi:hypothetical protein
VPQCTKDHGVHGCEPSHDCRDKHERDDHHNGGGRDCAPGQHHDGDNGGHGHDGDHGHGHDSEWHSGTPSSRSVTIRARTVAATLPPTGGDRLVWFAVIVGGCVAALATLTLVVRRRLVYR